MLAGATRFPAHAYIPDLEDSVPAAEKPAARDVVVKAIPALSGTGRPVIPRVNSLRSGLFDRDLEAVAVPGVTAISIGKIRSAEELRRVDTLLNRVEARHGLARGTIGVLPWIETAAAVAFAADICRCIARVRWVAFGAEDLAVDMGVPRAADLASGGPAATPTPPPQSEPLVMHARAIVAIAARAAGLDAIDTPYVYFRDEAGLLREAAAARRMGFKGKFAIHPAQVEPINRAFAPEEAEIARARTVIEAWEAAAREGRGAVSLNGEMVDVPVVERARAVLREAGVDRSRQGNGPGVTR
jgi:citrate lyase subunit beta/citryl-CoA lyase